ncbi:MAG: hypothetical protein HQL38_03145 [Alphaproteobacteria bacterium]|nr:hypothetical protein [Alphaproteobacteria bacterium]
MSVEKGCCTCRHARWAMTRHTPPRINVATFGECACPKESMLILMPLAVMSKEEVEAMRRRPAAAIWYDDPYVDCPTWSVK